MKCSVWILGVSILTILGIVLLILENHDINGIVITLLSAIAISGGAWGFWKYGIRKEELPYSLFTIVFKRRDAIRERSTVYDQASTSKSFALVILWGLCLASLGFFVQNIITMTRAEVVKVRGNQTFAIRRPGMYTLYQPRENGNKKDANIQLKSVKSARIINAIQIYGGIIFRHERETYHGLANYRIEEPGEYTVQTMANANTVFVVTPKTTVILILSTLFFFVSSFLWSAVGVFTMRDFFSRST